MHGSPLPGRLGIRFGAYCSLEVVFLNLIAAAFTPSG
jgi:hypothetical protein